MKCLLKLLFVFPLFLSLALPACAAGPDTSPASGDSTQPTLSDARQIIVYYLYFNPRCETCLNMEAYSKEAIEKSFAVEVKQGKIEWHSFDMDKPEHKHFWDDYELETKALVIAEMRDGKRIRWKDCEKIWDLADDKPAFVKYVRDEVQTFLNAD